MKDVPIGTNLTHSPFKRVAAVAPLYGDLVLLGKRITHCPLDGREIGYGGYWSPFGGTVEEGESSIEAARRELEEETLIKTEISFITYVGEIALEEGEYILYAHELSELFMPTLNFEHTEYGYFRIDSLQVAPSPVCPEVAAALQDFNVHRRHAW